MKKLEIMIKIAKTMHDDLFLTKTSEFIKMFVENGLELKDTYKFYTNEELDNHFFQDFLSNEDRVGFNYIYETILCGN